MPCSRGCCASQAEHYRNIQIGKGDLSPEVADINRRENELAKDRDAYKRLRADGLQPNDVTGSAQLEQHVQDQVEIDYKQRMDASTLARVKEAQAAEAMASWAGAANGR